MHSVFISYSSKDAETARMVQRTLVKNGIQCWMAPEDIPSGSNYAREIPQAIRACKVFLLVLSKNAQMSNWVLKELDNAVTWDKVIVPLMLEDFPLNDEFNFLLTGTQRYTAYRKNEESLDMLIKQIWEVTGVEPPAAETAVPENKEEETVKKEPVKEKPKKEKKKKPTPKPDTQTGPIVRTAKPVKVRPKKIRAPFTFGKVEALAALVIPGMLLVTYLGFILGRYNFNLQYLSSIYSGDVGGLIFTLVVGVLMGIAMWLEWVRFRHRGKMENPEAPCCPACKDTNVKQHVFLTRQMVVKEYLSLLLVPLCGFAGHIGIPALRKLCYMIVDEYCYNTPLNRQIMSRIGLVQGLAVGLYLANLLVRYMRRRSGLRSTVYRCSQCRAKFLPLRNKINKK